MNRIETPAGAKWDSIWREATGHLPQPAVVLREYAHLLPASGRALDLACGLGGNALFLARRGLVVDAWDVSAVAIDRLKVLASAQRLDVSAVVVDVSSEALPVATWDVITVSRFLLRPLCPALMSALKPGGLLFYQTYHKNKLTTAGPSNPEFLLEPNELLRLFGPLHVVAYREEGHSGDLGRGLRDEALFVGRRM